MDQVVNIIGVLIHHMVPTNQKRSVLTRIFILTGEFSSRTNECDVFREIEALKLFFTSEPCQVLKSAELFIIISVEVNLVTQHD